MSRIATSIGAFGTWVPQDDCHLMHDAEQLHGRGIGTGFDLALDGISHVERQGDAELR